MNIVGVSTLKTIYTHQNHIDTHKYMHKNQNILKTEYLNVKKINTRACFSVFVILASTCFQMPRQCFQMLFEI